MAKTVPELEADGFTIVSPGATKVSTATKSPEVSTKNEAPIVLIDTKGLSKAVEESNAVFKQSVENSNRAFQAGIERIVQSSIATKSDSFTLDINRDERGFMSSVTVKINK